jgi:hypothetical protein
MNGLALDLLTSIWPGLDADERTEILAFMPRSFPPLCRRLAALGNQVRLGERDLGWFRNCETLEDAGARYFDLLLQLDAACRFQFDGSSKQGRASSGMPGRSARISRRMHDDD